MSFNNRAALALVGALLATSACSGNGTVPTSPSGAGNSASQPSNADTNATLRAVDTSAALPVEDTPADSTSILKKLKKDVVIGSTVDPTNGDKGPRALSIVKVNYGFEEGAAARLQLRQLGRQRRQRNDDRRFRSKAGFEADDLYAKQRHRRLRRRRGHQRLTTCTARDSQRASLRALRRKES